MGEQAAPLRSLKSPLGPLRPGAAEASECSPSSVHLGPRTPPPSAEIPAGTLFAHLFLAESVGSQVPEENHRAWLTCPLSSDFRDKVPATHAQDAEKDSVSAGEAAGSADALGRRQRSPTPARPQGRALPGWSPGTRLRLLREANRACAANSWEAAAFHCPSSQDWQERRSLGPWGDAAGNTCTRGRLALSGRSLS